MAFLIEIVDVAKSFTKEDSDVTALENVNFEVHEGEFQCIVGPSGCGKSTLLRVIAGLCTPTSGVVKFKGVPVRGPHPKISMVFQSFALLPWKTVQENVELGLKLRGVGKFERRRASKEHLDMVGLSSFATSYPVELSGGMKQRVGFARALATDPEVVLLDEPFSALDELTASKLRNETLRLWRNMQKTFVMVTHSISEAVELAERVVVLTASPAMVREIVDIEMELPRRKGECRFNEYERKLFSLIDTEMNKLYDMEAEEPAQTS